MSTPTTNSVAVQPVAASADYRIASLVAGMRWGTEPGVTLAYSFASATSVWDSAADEYGLAGTGSEPYTGVAALTGPQKEAVRTALATWSNVANVKFGEVPDDATTVGELRFAWSALGGTTPTHAYAPSTVAKAADVWLNSSATFLRPTDCSTWSHRSGPTRRRGIACSRVTLARLAWSSVEAPAVVGSPRRLDGQGAVRERPAAVTVRRSPWPNPARAASPGVQGAGLSRSFTGTRLSVRPHASHGGGGRGWRGCGRRTSPGGA